MLDLSCIITKEKENLFCAWCPKMEIASDSKTITPHKIVYSKADGSKKEYDFS